MKKRTIAITIPTLLASLGLAKMVTNLAYEDMYTHVTDTEAIRNDQLDFRRYFQEQQPQSYKNWDRLEAMLYSAQNDIVVGCNRLPEQFASNLLTNKIAQRLAKKELTLRISQNQQTLPEQIMELVHYGNVEIQTGMPAPKQSFVVTDNHYVALIQQAPKTLDDKVRFTHGKGIANSLIGEYGHLIM
jgi:hypothetical protein